MTVKKGTARGERFTHVDGGGEAVEVAAAAAAAAAWKARALSVRGGGCGGRRGTLGEDQ